MSCIIINISRAYFMAASCKMGTGSLPGLKCGRGVLLTTHPLLVPRSWKSRVIPPPRLGHNRACNAVTLPLPLFISWNVFSYSIHRLFKYFPWYILGKFKVWCLNFLMRCGEPPFLWQSDEQLWGLFFFFCRPEGKEGTVHGKGFTILYVETPPPLKKAILFRRVRKIAKSDY